MEWDDKYSVGIPEIDEEHKTIIDCITLLENATNRKRRWLEIHSALVHLSYYGETHFRVEEAVMRICQYPSLESHIAEHRSFSDQIDSLKKKSLSVDITVEMISFLHGWLANHIMSRDKHYADYMRKRFDLKDPQA